MKIIAVLGLFLCCFNNLYGQSSFSELALPYGNYGVGFKHYTINDNTRTYQRLYDWNNQILARPIPISTWFPSHLQPQNSRLMTIEDYMIVLKEEEEWESLPTERILDWFYYSNSTANKSHLKEKVKAIKNASPLSKKFPVAIYAPSYQASSVENFALCELLASQGFIVISSPSRGTENRFLDNGTTRDIETQTRDIQFLINEAEKLPYADSKNIAVIGFSFGGISNILAQMVDKRIKAIVCLDGSIKYQLQKIQLSPYFKLSNFDVPFIFMSQKDIPEKVMKEDKIDTLLNSKFEFYDSLKYSTAYSLKFHDLTHSYFSSMGVLFQDRDARQDKSDKAIMNSYRWLNIYTLNFLNAYLGNNSPAKAFLENTPTQNGVDIGIISKKSKIPIQQNISFEGFNLLASKQNYKNLNDLYKTQLNRSPNFKLDEWKLNNLGLTLLFKNKLKEGIDVLTLNTTLFPESANTYDSLAEGYLIAGDKKNATINFKKSLQFDPQNQNAINRLKTLGD
jgi:dienelactone hydrolase